jgi:hypothetical protein
VRDGLKNEQDRRTECLRNVDYYNLRGIKLLPRRDAESQADFLNRPKRSLPFVPRVIRTLTSKMYNPGPGRKIDDDDAATEWLEAVYRDNLINSLWQRADRMAHLNGMCAFQVAATGDADKPIKLQLWSGWHEVIPFELPGKANEIAAVVTIDSVDNLTRYTYWTDEFYRTYETDKLKPYQTAGGRAARFIPDESGPNPYGVLPFAFVWYELPIAGVDSVHGLGNFLSDINLTIDQEMSDLAQAVQCYHTPTPLLFDADVSLNPVKKMGGWVRINSVPTDLERGPSPRLEYAQAGLDIVGGWANIRGVIDSELEALGVPLTAYRMDSATLPSGAALVAEQKPLQDYAVERREPQRRYEDDLKTVCCQVAGAYYGRADLTAAAALPLTLTWAPVTIDLPGQERDQTDADSVSAGYESPVMVVMRRFGMSREQALEHLQQVADDHAELAEIMKDVNAAESKPIGERTPPPEPGDGTPGATPQADDEGDVLAVANPKYDAAGDDE